MAKSYRLRPNPPENMKQIKMTSLHHCMSDLSITPTLFNILYEYLIMFYSLLKKVV